MRVFWHQGSQEDRKNTEETEAKQINLKMRVFLTPRPTRRQKEHRRDRNKANQLKANQLKMKIFWYQGPQEDRKSTEETKTKQINLKQTNLRWAFLDTKAHKKTEGAQKRQKQSKSTKDESFLTPRPTRRQKEHRRDRNKASQLKMRVFWHQGPQEDRKSTEETETKQINLRWEFS